MEKKESLKPIIRLFVVFGTLLILGAALFTWGAIDSVQANSLATKNIAWTAFFDGSKDDDVNEMIVEMKSFLTKNLGPKDSFDSLSKIIENCYATEDNSYDDYRGWVNNRYTLSAMQALMFDTGLTLTDKISLFEMVISSNLKAKGKSYTFIQVYLSDKDLLQLVLEGKIDLKGLLVNYQRSWIWKVIAGVMLIIVDVSWFFKRTAKPKMRKE
jgi:hypothetical protein